MLKLTESHERIIDMPELNLAVKLSIPIFFAYFPLGIVFGVLFAHSGYTWYLAPLMSVLVYGGSIQFVALSMMTEHAGVIAITIACLFIAFRNSFYGLSLLNRFNTHWLLKSFLIFTLVDATYVILIANPAKKELNDLRFCVILSALIYSYWIVGTLLGAAFADWIPSFPALSFILPCFFMTLVVDYFIAKRKLHSVIMPIIAAIIAYFINPAHFLLVAIIISIIAILSIDAISRKKSHER